MATLKEIQRSIKRHEGKAEKQQILAKAMKEKRLAEAKLFNLKHRRAIAAGKKFKSLSKRFGRGLLKTGKSAGRKVGPAILKQARLIQEQQSRDAAKEQAMFNKPPIKLKKRAKSSKRKKR